MTDRTIATIGTHSGSFHADDALGCAVIATLYPSATITRSRDMGILAQCDILVDVGGEYDEARQRFDHHQKGFDEKRLNGIPYAGAGLVWKTYGRRYVQLLVPELSAEEAGQVVSRVDELFIQHADAMDSGIAVDGPFDYGFTGLIHGLNNTWAESDPDDERFELALYMAATALRSVTVGQAAQIRANTMVQKAEQQADGRILVMDVARLPYEEYVVAHMPEVLFAVYPESQGRQYQVKVIPQVIGQFKARVDLPAEWAGLRDGALAAVTGVVDAVFCHNGRFIAGASSLEGALALAHMAIAKVVPNADTAPMVNLFAATESIGERDIPDSVVSELIELIKYRNPLKSCPDEVRLLLRKHGVTCQPASQP